jgi:hypothetical protein
MTREVHVIPPPVAVGVAGTVISFSVQVLRTRISPVAGVNAAVVMVAPDEAVEARCEAASAIAITAS